MKYPYIGELKSGSGGVVIFDSKDSGSQLNCSGEHWDKEDLHKHLSEVWVESQFKNITREYLSNTYGKVESKEHAGFIVELAEVNGIEVINDYEGGVMWFNCKGGLLDFYRDKNTASNDREKLITIPLPPKQDDSDEWPKVGDTVTWGSKVCNGVVKGFDDRIAWVKNEHGNYCNVEVNELEKPKTPEEELREKSIKEISQQIRNSHPSIGWIESEKIASDLYDAGLVK